MYTATTLQSIWVIGNWPTSLGNCPTSFDFTAYTSNTMVDLHTFFRWCRSIVEDSKDGSDNHIWVFRMYACDTKCWCWVVCCIRVCQPLVFNQSLSCLQFPPMRSIKLYIVIEHTFVQFLWCHTNSIHITLCLESRFYKVQEIYNIKKISWPTIHLETIDFFATIFA